MPRPTAFAYAAHAGSNTFLLDDDGICRRILTRGKNRVSTNKSTQRCLGAQYVASLDFSSDTGLVERPKEGCPLLFARVDEHGRVSLVRTAALERFEEIDRELDTEEHPSFERVDGPHFDEDPPRTRREPPPSARREPPPATRREPPPTTRREPTPATRRDPRVDSRRLLSRTLIGPRSDYPPQPPHAVDIDYGGERPRPQPRALPALDEEDDFSTTIVAERPAVFAKKRGMLPKGRETPPPAAGKPPTLRPPPPGRKTGR